LASPSSCSCNDHNESSLPFLQVATLHAFCGGVCNLHKYLCHSPSSLINLLAGTELQHRCNSSIKPGSVPTFCVTIFFVSICNLVGSRCTFLVSRNQDENELAVGPMPPSCILVATCILATLGTSWMTIRQLHPGCNANCILVATPIASWLQLMLLLVALWSQLVAVSVATRLQTRWCCILDATGGCTR
jgi:hypothetical protein